MLKKICSFFILIFLALMLFTGCTQLSALYASSVSEESQVPSSMENSPSPSASPSRKPVFPPLPAYLIKIDEKFSADINNDGVSETLEIINDKGKDPEDGYDDVISLSVTGASHSYKIDLDSYYYYCPDAYFARTQSGAVCLLVNISSAADDYTTASVISFSGVQPVVMGEIEGKVFETINTTIGVKGDIDAFGTWEYNRFLTLCDDFTLVPETDYRIIIGEKGPLHTIRKLPVQMLVGGVYQKQQLKKNTDIFPVSTDGSSYLDFSLIDNTEGRIYTKIEYESCIDGISEDQYFDNIEYSD